MTNKSFDECRADILNLSDTDGQEGHLTILIIYLWFHALTVVIHFQVFLPSNTPMAYLRRFELIL